jgi:hypothetical protein
MPIREEEVDRHGKGNRPSVSLVTRQVETACTPTKTANFGRRRERRWIGGSLKARREKSRPIRKGRHNPSRMKLPHPDPELPPPRKVGVNGE